MVDNFAFAISNKIIRTKWFNVKWWSSQPFSPFLFFLFCSFQENLLYFVNCHWTM